jgi:hypothetical protein
MGDEQIFENGTPEEVFQYLRRICSYANSRRIEIEMWGDADFDKEPIDDIQYYICGHAKFNIGGRWPAAEKYMVKNEFTSHGLNYYIENIVTERSDDLDEIFLNSAYIEAIFLYVETFFKNSRWPDAEQAMLQLMHKNKDDAMDIAHLIDYATRNIRGPWKEIECFVKTCPLMIVKYAINCCPEIRKKEYEDILIKDLKQYLKNPKEFPMSYIMNIMTYFQYIVKDGHWPEAIEIIKSDAALAVLFAACLRKSRWDDREVENNIIHGGSKEDILTYAVLAGEEWKAAAMARYNI